MFYGAVRPNYRRCFKAASVISSAARAPWPAPASIFWKNSAQMALVPHTELLIVNDGPTRLKTEV